MHSRHLVFVVFLVLSATRARADCRLPDDGSPKQTWDSQCPRFEWQETGGVLHIAPASEPIWVDAAGGVHVATHAAEVPEPFRSMYAAQHGRAHDGSFADVAFTDSATHDAMGFDVADEASPRASTVMLQRHRWRTTVATWRLELFTSAHALLEAVMQPYALTQNPISFAYPPATALMHAQDGAAVAAARARVLKARSMLLYELPQQARAEHVPPLWLQ